MRKRYVLLVIVIISVVIFNVPKSYANNKLDSVELKENNEINKKAFAMYVENNLHEYEPYTEDSNYFPNSLKYHYNEDMSKCVDNNDQEVEGILTHNEDNSVTVTSNRTVYCYLYFDLDKVNPGTPEASLSSLSSIDNNYTNTKLQTVTIIYNDEDIESYCISLNSDTCNEYKTEGLNNVDKKITINSYDLGEDGSKTIKVWLKDLAGNISDTPKTINIILDTQAPVINNLTVSGVTTYSNVNYVKVTNPNVTITWSDDDVAKYCMSNAACTPGTSISDKTVTAAVTLINNATNTIHAKIIDKAGNVSVDKTYGLTVDTAINNISKVYIGGNTNSNPTYVTTNTPTVYIEWPDGDIIKYCVTTSATCTPNVDVTVGTKNVTTGAISLGADGTRSVNVVIQDRAGNTKSSSDSVTVDTTNPTYNLQKSGDYTNQIVINTNANDVTSGIQSVTCSATKGTCACTGTTNAVCTNSGLTGGVSSTITVTIKDKAGKSVTPNTTQTTKIDTAAGYIESKAPSGLNKTIQGGMYRFQGAQGSVNNYICFGTDNKETCTANPDLYMYRIIGIVKDASDSTLANQIGAIKIMMNNYIQGNDNYSIYAVSDSSKPWNGLNGKCTSSNKNYCPDTNLFLGSKDNYNKKYPYLNPNDSSYNTWINKIITKDWYNGEIGRDFLPANAEALYKIETGTAETKYYQYGGSRVVTESYSLYEEKFKINVPYLHDYLFASKSFCIENKTSECYKSWMYMQWMVFASQGGYIMAKNTNSYAQSWVIDYYSSWAETSGIYSDDCIYLSVVNYIRPTFYLDKSTVIKSGIGSESDPFIIQV